MRNANPLFYFDIEKQSDVSKPEAKYSATLLLILSIAMLCLVGIGNKP
jgi:hypothetical protein